MLWRGVFRLWRHPDGRGWEAAVSGYALVVVTLLISNSLVAMGAPAEAGSGPDIVVVGGASVVSPDVVAQLMECTTGTVRRDSGANRYATAAALSYNTWASANRAYLATGTGYADAVAAGPVAGTDLAPVLLTRPDSLPGATASEIQRLGASEVIMIGGPAAIHPSVEGQIGVAVHRIAGPDRYATAAALSASAFPHGADTAFVATGTLFPDALSAAPAATQRSAPVLLVAPDRVPAATASELQRLGADTIVIVGGPAAVSTSVETQLGDIAATIRWAGANRYATAAAVSRKTFDPGVGTIHVATGADFPDALAAGAAAAASRGPILLVGNNTIPGSTAAEIARLTGTPCRAGEPPRRVILQSDGLGIIDFGTLEDDALDVLFTVFGPPTGSWDGVHPDGYLTYWIDYYWSTRTGSFAVSMTDRWCRDTCDRVPRFTGWHLSGDSGMPLLATAVGITSGSTGRELLTAYEPDISIFSPWAPLECGPWNEWGFYTAPSIDGSLTGELTGDPNTLGTVVSYIEGGFPGRYDCIAW
jgi:putative cell wall-binding protein